MLRIIFIYFIVSKNFSYSQPSPKFKPFDWVVHLSPGKINSISEGYTYAYIATENGGIFRYNLYGNSFSEPITMAQGLNSNKISSIYFDQKKGVLWAASSEYLHYSYNREGDWFKIPLSNYGLSRYENISRIGSSQNFIWLKTNSLYVKVESSSGISLGLYPVPDEKNIQWSSEPYQAYDYQTNILMNYNFMFNWSLNGKYLMNQYGQRERVTTFFNGDFNNVWAGSDKGTLFQGNKNMETFFPLEIGLNSDFVSCMVLDGNDVLIGYSNFLMGGGISKISDRSLILEHYDFDLTVNMDPTDIYSIYKDDNSIWAGGEGVVLYFNDSNNYWRTLGSDRGIPGVNISSIVGDSLSIWIGSNQGLRHISQYSKRVETVGFESIFNNHPVYDLLINDIGLWISTSKGVFVYDKKNPQVLNAELIGFSYLDFSMSNVKISYQDDNRIYFSCNLGIVLFDIEEKSWRLIASIELFENKNILSLYAIDDFIFIGTNNGLYRFSYKSGILKKYEYPFISNVFDITSINKIIWMATDKGLIQFNWKRDL